MNDVPQLRFKRFYGPWSKVPLGKISSVNPSTDSLPNEFRYIDLESVKSGILSDPATVEKTDAPSRAQRVLNRLDILFQMVRPYQQNNYFFDMPGSFVASTGYAQIRYKAAPKYLYQFLHTSAFVKKVFVRSTGSNYPAINSSDLKSIKVWIPREKDEQKKIGDFLWAVDEKIRLQHTRYHAMRAFKKCVMKKIFTQTLRFKADDGSDFPDWETKPLNKVLFEPKKRNYDLKYGKNQVLSVSGEKGIVNQVDHLGRSYAGAKVDNYHVVEVGDVVYTKSPLKLNPYGIIKTNKGEAGIVSTLYAVYRPFDERSGNYIDHYFSVDDNLNRYLRPLVRKGAKNDMKINNSDVLSDPISIPSFAEQQKIADFFSAIDDKISAVANQLTQMQDFKKGLLQQMFV